jgi:hypothetical protein
MTDDTMIARVISGIDKVVRSFHGVFIADVSDIAQEKKKINKDKLIGPHGDDQKEEPFCQDHGMGSGCLAVSSLCDPHLSSTSLLACPPGHEGFPSFLGTHPALSSLSDPLSIFSTPTPGR